MSSETIVQECIKDTARFNAMFMKKSRNARCCNLQTMIIECRTLNRVNNKREEHHNVNLRDVYKRIAYPVALLPGQYAHNYVTHKSGQPFKVDSGLDQKVHLINEKALSPIVEQSEASSKKPQSVATCVICKEASPFLSKVQSCSVCNRIFHLKCIRMESDMAEIVSQYDWQCSSCKSCTICKRLSSGDQMMFCDRCDRGYHSFCVGLEQVPEESWTCRPCAAEQNGTDDIGPLENTGKKKRKRGRVPKCLAEGRKRKVSAGGSTTK